MANKNKKTTKPVVEEQITKPETTQPVVEEAGAKPVDVIKTAMDEVEKVKVKAQNDYDKAYAGLKIVRH